MADVTRLGPSGFQTPEQILAIATTEPWDNVMVLGYFNGSGALVLRSSRLTRAEALWLVEHAKMYILNCDDGGFEN